MNKPFSQACENNRMPIFFQLDRLCKPEMKLLEIGSGTGQHAVYLGSELGLTWQTSDLIENHNAINTWLEDAAKDNIKAPIELDVNRPFSVDLAEYQAIFTANTLHIMPSYSVEALFEQLADCAQNTQLFVYGPFNYDGQYTSQSNAQFDQWLAEQSTLSAIRDFEWIDELAQSAGFSLQEDIAMPANNRFLVFKKTSAANNSLSQSA